MKRHLLLNLVLSAITFAQVGIKSEFPDATLHLEPSSKTSPSGVDGILVPRVNNLPLAEPERLGQLLFLENNTTGLANNFYYWNGTEWISFPNSIVKEVDETIYSFDGTGYTGSGATRNINFSRFVKKDREGFSVSNNEIIVGKAGGYAISFTGSVKRPTADLEIQSNFEFSVYVNGTKVSSTSSSISAEMTSSTSVSYTFFRNLRSGDKITCRVTKSNEGGYNYQSYGINNLTLYFLKP